MTEYLKAGVSVDTPAFFSVPYARGLLFGRLLLTALHVDLVTFPATHDQCRSILKVISIVITERDNGRPVLTDITVMFFGKRPESNRSRCRPSNGK